MERPIVEGSWARVQWQQGKWWRTWRRVEGGPPLLSSKVRVLKIQKRTAHVETRRDDGVVGRRWVKLSRLYPWQG